MKLRRFLITAFTFIITVMVSAQEKQVINRADELPRRSIQLSGTALEIIEDQSQLNRLVDDLIENLESDLDRFEINDVATVKNYYLSLASCYLFKNELETSLAYIEKVQELEDKESDKLTTGIFLRSYIRTQEKYDDITSNAFANAFKEDFKRSWEELPYVVVQDELEAQRGRLSVFNPSLVTAGLESQIQPYLNNNNNYVPEGLVMSFVGIRLQLDIRAPLTPAMLEVLNEIYENNQSTVESYNIWDERDIYLNPEADADPVVVAIWDSGTDTDIFPEESLYTDRNGKHGIGYSLATFEKDNLLLDNPDGRITSDLGRLQTLTKGLMDLQAAIESPEVAEVRQAMAALQPNEVQQFQEELAFYGNYAHGTHVAGIAMKGNPFARLLVARLGFDHRSIPHLHTMEDATFQANMYTEAVAYFKANNVRVVNMSWRYGSASYEGILSLHGVGENEDERRAMAREMFDLEKQALYNAIKSAPEILFICGSGNEANDANFDEYIPASFHDLPNLITIGAVNNEGRKTSFTTEGKGIVFYANGFEVESYVPGGDIVRFSGTSMASPQVTNLAAKILAINPRLSPTEVIELIEQGSDPMEEDPELLLINPLRTLQSIGDEDQLQRPNSQAIMGTWMPSQETAESMVDTYLEQLSSENPQQAEAMLAQKGMLIQVFAETRISYDQNGVMRMEVPGAPTQEGTWELTENQTRVNTVIGGKPNFQTIVSIQDGELKTETSKGLSCTFLRIEESE